MNNFGNFCYFFEIFNETLETKYQEKSENMFFLMEKKTNKAKLEIFKFLRKSALSPLIKLEVIMPYLQILQKYAY